MSCCVLKHSLARVCMACMAHHPLHHPPNPPPPQHQNKLQGAQRPFNVVVTSYEGVLKERTALEKIQWRYVIIDEVLFYIFIYI